MHLQSFLLFTALAAACAKEPNEIGLHVKRDAVPLAPFPPQLTSEEAILVNSFDSASIDSSSYYYTHGLHVAGTNKSMAQWTADRWAENGFESRLIEYYVYINYPLEQKLSLAYSNGTSHEINLNEDVIAEDETTSYPNRVPSFHGYSASGTVTAPYVYVGRGQKADFEALESLGVELEGKIALARYGGPFRGLKVKNAQEHGMIGAVIFTDPADDGEFTFVNGYEPYPNGPARQPSSVQRGSVQFLSTYPGDPTTPGYPSHEGVPRANKAPTTPKIPSLPLSYANAEPLLAALNGYGSVPDRPIWKGNLSADYTTGPNPEVQLTLVNSMNETHTHIWDTIGIINGTSQDEVIVIGNHRDAWIIGGAADPNSGSAIMVELSKALGKQISLTTGIVLPCNYVNSRLMMPFLEAGNDPSHVRLSSRLGVNSGNLAASGWKPKRTIILASWDMEEYGLVGSTEFVEEYIPWLTGAAVSYLNIDVGSSGPVPEISASPEHHSLLLDTMKKVIYPNVGSVDLYPQQTLYDVWANVSGSLGVLGSGSDYTSFLHNGIGCVDLGATNGRKDPVYHYHSNYDTYHWMTKFGDPGFKVHVAMGQFLSLLAYHLSSDTVIPFNVTTYTDRLQAYYTDLEYTLGNSTCCKKVDISSLSAAIETFGGAASVITDLAASGTADEAAINVINQKYRDFSRGFVSQGGLPNREFYKHVVFAPGLDTGYAPTTYAGITEAVTFGSNATLAQEWVGKTSRAIEAAAAILSL